MLHTAPDARPRVCSFAVWVFPLGAAVVALVFAALLGAQFVRRRRPFQAAWTLALLMYAVASFAMFLGVQDGWSTGEYRVYWLFGAILNVPWLAMGELYLLVRDRRVTSTLLILLLFATAFAVARVRTGTLDPTALGKDLPLGKDAWAGDTLPYRLSQLYAYPAYVVLLLGTGWSVWRMRGQPAVRDRMMGTVLVAVGATIVAIGSGVGAGLDVVPLFSAGLLVGIAVMFWGFVLASRGPRRSATATPATRAASPAPARRGTDPSAPR